MPIIATTATTTKKALIARKKKLLSDIKYYEERINEDMRANASISVNFEDSSDSENECVFTINNGPMLNELESQQKMLKTDLRATQELALLKVLQSKVDVMVEDPVLLRESHVLQPGVWKEVNAECRIDLVPFATTFYVHQADGNFGAKSYYSLKVLPVKLAQEVELSKSVLPTVKTPSDAVEVLRSYAAEYRSRRTTLARLADKYANNLYMEPMREGGYLLKFANLLEISWVLENKWSPVAPFYHKMIFELENMDERYIKIIKHAHKQVVNPSIDTDQRTLLLAKIITTCLEAQGTQELYESMDSESESVKKIEKRRLTLENEAPEAKKVRNGGKNDDVEDGNIGNKDNIDGQIMAPPKSLPKKVKPKGKENTNQNQKPVKRAAVENDSSNSKKAKTYINVPNKVRQIENDNNKVVEKDIHNANAKNKDKIVKSQTNTEKSAKSLEKVKKQISKATPVSTDAEAQIDQANENNTASVKTKDKAAIVPNNEKESRIDIKKAKVVKSKNQEHPNKEKDNMQSKGNVNVPENPKKKAVKKTEPQKMDSNDKIIASSKNDLNTNIPVSQKVSSKNNIVSDSKTPNVKNLETDKASELKMKDKTIASSKNDPKDKNPETEKVIKLKSKDKMMASSKNDSSPKNSNSNPTKESDKPIIDKKVISTTNDLITTDNYAKSSSNNAKLVDIDEIPIMSANYNNIDNEPKKTNIKATKKQRVIKNTIFNKKTMNTESNAQNVQLTKPTDNVNVPKKSAKKNMQKSSKLNKSNSNNLKKTNALKLTPTTKVIDVTKDPKNGGKRTDRKQSNIAVTEKVASVSNAVTKTKNIANMANIIKNGDEKPKLAIKTLTHKSIAAVKKVAEKFKTKNANAGNIDKIPKDNDSASKFTKIPMKLSIHESLKKKNPLRMSPRQMPSSFRSSSDTNMKQKTSYTNIPRLLKKPQPKKIVK